MKYLTVLLFCFLFDNCPPQGDSNKDKLQKMDLLKNRIDSSANVIPISLDTILKPGDDSKRFSSNMYVDIKGFVFDVKRGGVETCNCHSKDKSQLDTHIEIVKDLLNSSGYHRIIVEINRYTFAKNERMNFNNVKLLKGKEVEIKGWLFFDDEHKQNAINTNPNGTNIWRATCWEIHPCININKIN